MNRGNKKYDIISFLAILITLMMVVLAGNVFLINDKVIIAKAESQINEEQSKTDKDKNNFFIHIINKSMSIFEINYKENGGEDTSALIKDFFAKAVNVSYKNPKSLIKAQISMMNDIESYVETSSEDSESIGETEDYDTSQIYIAEDYITPDTNNNESTQQISGNNPYKEDIQVINDDNSVEKTEKENNEGQGLTSEIEIVSTPVPAPMKIRHSIDEPLIFIYHTHGTESYRPESVGNYHSLNRKYTVIRVGEEMTKYLENSGFKVVHDDTIHDYPSYEGSYKRSLETLNKNFKSNSSLKVVFDIHRDGIDNVDQLNEKEYQTIRERSYVEINGEKVSKFAIVLGGGNENIEQLKEFAYYIKAVSDELYPGFARPIILKKFKYNQYKSNYYALLEVGNNTNTIEESERAAKYLGEVINQALRKCIVSP